MDQADNYKHAMKRLVRDRKKALYRHIGLVPTSDINDVDYYHLLDVIALTEKLYGKDFTKWLLKTLAPNEALFRLAEESGVVLLPAQGFGAKDPSFRVSLANLNEVDYEKIGKAVYTIGEKYYEEYKKSLKKSSKKK